MFRDCEKTIEMLHVIIQVAIENLFLHTWQGCLPSPGQAFQYIP